jgi:hypothetical protein
MQQRRSSVSIGRSREYWLRLNHWWCAWQTVRARKKWQRCLQKSDLAAASAWFQASQWWGQRRVEACLLLKTLKENEQSKTAPVTVSC